jgi:uncharacterized peroxidase-related enzyme
MPWIRIVEEIDSTRKLKENYEKIVKKRGKLSNIMKIHSLNPIAMDKHMDLYLSIMFGSSNLSREDRELIAVVVSSLNKCPYCIKHHAEALNHYWKNDQKLQKLIIDYKSVDLPEKIIKMLDYVFKLTKNPYNVNKIDVDNLKSMGFLDEDILNINLVTSYFNFVNRIALGLGVEFSDDEVAGYKY